MRGEAIRALIRFVYRFDDSELRSEGFAELEKHVGEQEPRLSVAAAMAEGTARLYLTSKSWMQKYAGQIFGDHAPTSPIQQVALSTVLAVHHFHPELLELLRSPILNSLQEGRSIKRVNGWRSDRSFNHLVGDWVYMGFVVGSLAYEDDLIASWLEYASPEERGDVLGHLAWKAMKWESISSDILERMAELWDRRFAQVVAYAEGLEELAEFYWFIRCTKFEVSWWLPRFLKVTTIIEKFRSRGLIGDQLIEASKSDPVTTFSVLENLIGESIEDDDFSRYDLIDHAAPPIIAAIIGMGDPDLTLRAKHLMNIFAEFGYIEIEEWVDKFRS
jgi:hypothetical protein